MKKTLILCALLVASITMTVIVNSHNKLNDLFEANINALADDETLMGHCEDKVNSCLAKCSKCNRWFYAPGKKGGAYNVAATCSECAN